MEPENVLKPKFGIVAMIDALGVRNATIHESVEFIKNVQELVNNLPDFLSGFFAGSPKQKKLETEPPTLTTFGDTIIFSWEMKREEVHEYLPDIGVFLSYAVLAGLESKMAFRGAVSIGDYIQSESTILGPAIGDVAAWYDLPEMIGVIATPYCCSLLSEIHESKHLENGEFVKYSIPLKNGSSKELWTVGWPDLLSLESKKDDKKSALTKYYKLIQNFQIPKGTEDKYLNTEKFARVLLK